MVRMPQELWGPAQINFILPFGTDHVLVAGMFDSVNGVARNGIAVLHTLGLSDPERPVNFIRTEGGFNFTLPVTQNGRDYWIEYSDALTPPDWQLLEQIHGDGSVKTVTDSGTSRERFYRIRSP